MTVTESTLLAKCRHVVLFDMARCRSHLVFRYMSTHADVQSQWHPYLEASLLGPERLTRYSDPSLLQDGTMGEFRVGVSDGTYADASKDVLAARADAAKQGKVLVTNEHVQFALKHELCVAFMRGTDYMTPLNELENPTWFPDEVFQDIEPVFVIRNPVFGVPSNLVALLATAPTRPGHGDWRALLAVPLQRAFFDYMTKKRRKRPLVVDGDDVLWRPDDLSKSLCKELGLQDALKTKWDVWPEKERQDNFILSYFLKDIYDSTGLIFPEDGRPDDDVGVNHAKWVEKFGQELADQLKETVVENLPHYQYMKQFKV